jgi:hypothetical protein
MRDMDTDNLGYLTNDQVYKVMLQQMKLQREVFGLKRMSCVFVFIIVMLSLATLGTSFAAASLAKDTDVKNGILVVKGGDGAVGTSNVASTYTLTEESLSDSGRRLDRAIESTFTSITKADALSAYTKCSSETVFLEESCGTNADTTVDVKICPGNSFSKAGSSASYTYVTEGSDTVTIDCTDASTDKCVVAFSAGNACTAINVNTLGSNGVWLLPDRYIATGTVALPGILYLATTVGDTAPWIFTFDSGTFITAAGSEVAFKVTGSDGEIATIRYSDSDYGLYAARVTWEVNSAITLGAESKVGGTMRSTQTITLGASAICDRLEAEAAITLGASAKSGPIIGEVAVTVGAGATAGPVRAGAAILVGAGAVINSLGNGGVAAIVVGAGVTCESDGHTWSVADQCFCDPSTYDAADCV